MYITSLHDSMRFFNFKKDIVYLENNNKKLELKLQKLQI